MDPISRDRLRLELKVTLRQFRVTALLGPRQCGKTTLARALDVPPEAFFDLEDPIDVARLRAPRVTLGALKGLVIIDEVQRMPELFPLLRVLADRPDNPAKFLLLGSASPELARGASESLAGRVGFIDATGFELMEVGPEKLDQLWLRGGFPESFLSKSDSASLAWRNSFIRTFLTRDMPQFGVQVATERLRRFWMMLAHYHGQTWNASEIGTSLALDYKTCQHYLEILNHTFLVRTLQPWTENLGKRIRRAPKVYLRDSGLLHALLGLGTKRELQSHPKLGASWEGFALEQIIRAMRLTTDEVFYWSVHSGPELDLLVLRDGKRIGFEFKFVDAPGLTRSMISAQEALGLDHLYVIYPGGIRYKIDTAVEALPLTDVAVLAPRKNR